LDIGVSLNQSNTIQQRLILELWKEGIFTQEDRMKIIELLNLGTASHALRSDIVDREKALRENQAFLDDAYGKKREEGGVFCWIHDDHALHINTHTDWGKSEEAQKWPEERWKAFEKHILKHLEWLVALQRGAQTIEKGPGVESPREEPGGGMPGPTPGEGPGMGPEIEGTAPPAEM